MAVKKNLKEKKKLFIVLLIVFSFSFNIIWEVFHSTLYYHSDVNFNSFSELMIYASFIDMILILGVFIFIALIFKDFYFNKRKSLILFIILLVLTAIIIEARALTSGRWAYNNLMPTFFGIGLTPLIQLFTTGIVSIYLTKYLLRIKK